MIVCVPVDESGQIDRWGRARTVAVATVVDGEVTGWQEQAVRWDEAHDAGTEGSHHARIARFVREQGTDVVVAGHMGPPMQNMLEKMGVSVRLGAQGDAQAAVSAALHR